MYSADILRFSNLRTNQEPSIYTETSAIAFVFLFPIPTEREQQTGSERGGKPRFMVFRLTLISTTRHVATRRSMRDQCICDKHKHRTEFQLKKMSILQSARSMCYRVEHVEHGQGRSQVSWKFNYKNIGRVPKYSALVDCKAACT